LARTTDGRPFKQKKLSVLFLYAGVPAGLTPFRELVPLGRRNWCLFYPRHTLWEGGSSVEIPIKPRSRVERLPPSSHVKEPSVTTHYEHYAGRPFKQKKLSVPFLYAGVPAGLTSFRELVPLGWRNWCLFYPRHTLWEGGSSVEIPTCCTG
jgi:hypothetical protein